MQTEVVATESIHSQTAERFSSNECENFERDGYVIVRGLADAATVATMIDVVRTGLSAIDPGPVEFEADLHYPGAPETRQSQGGNTIRRLKEALENMMPAEAASSTSGRWLSTVVTISMKSSPSRSSIAAASV